MTARRESDLAAHRERAAAIRACRRCDPSGWRLGPDGRASDLAVRCHHRPPPPGRDPTGPIYEPNANDEHQPEGNRR